MVVDDEDFRFLQLIVFIGEKWRMEKAAWTHGMPADGAGARLPFLFFFLIPVVNGVLENIFCAKNSSKTTPETKFKDFVA